MPKKVITSDETWVYCYNARKAKTEKARQVSEM